MLWHLCDISCHNIESICPQQVLFLMAMFVALAMLFFLFFNFQLSIEDPDPVGTVNLLTSHQSPIKSHSGGNQCWHQEK
jgi:hypothetical protein